MKELCYQKKTLDKEDLGDQRRVLDNLREGKGTIGTLGELVLHMN